MSKRTTSEQKKRKADSKKAAQYLKAKFNQKIGYIFIALWYFIRNNFIYHKKKIGILLSIMSFGLIVFSFYNLLIANQIEKKVKAYEDNNAKLEQQITSKQKDTNELNKKIDEFNISSSPEITRAYKAITHVMDGMYNYDNSTEYRNNREKNLQYFSDPSSEYVNKVYNNDTDSSGDSLIENLNLKSSLQHHSIYTENVKNDSKTLKFKSIVKYQSDISGVSSSFATRTHNAVYNIEFDTEKNKILSMKKMNNLKEKNIAE
ncbi:hypothetical protein [Staphylococcus simulans]|uniref:hypothetical protein n=1 Tax=Staphylococcus simulans TaxID=1286 RepID=UPI000D1E6435|nr:hypothetical protein [Staphylococcus simulans]PTJ36435.1 hypothetical protein BU024_10250 [Staphylococcus simulans]